MQRALSPIELRLLALVTTERAGREIAKLYEDETGDEIRHGTQYTSLRRMRERGWVRMREDRELDLRIRLFVATAEGTDKLERSREHYAELSEFGL